MRGRAATSAESGPSGHPLVPLCSALLARSGETAIRMPLEVLRTVMQTSDGTSTLSSTVRHLVKQPIASWWRGMMPTLLRDVPFSGIYWASYEQAKARVHIPETWSSSESVRTLLHSFTCGAGAGLFAAILTTPVDVIKTVRQYDHPGRTGAKTRSARRARTRPGARSNRGPSVGRHTLSTRSCCCSYFGILRMIHEKPDLAFAGIGPRMVRIPAGVAFMMVGIEVTRNWFERRRAEER